MANGPTVSIGSDLNDPVTEISSRLGFELIGAYTLQACGRLGRSVSLFAFDVATADPAANHLFGSPDETDLATFARILLSTFPRSDVIGRTGKEQFGMLMSDTASCEVAAVLAQLRDAVARHNDGSPCEPTIGYDAGSAIGDPTSTLEFERLLAAASRNMVPQVLLPNADVNFTFDHLSRL